MTQAYAQPIPPPHPCRRGDIVEYVNARATNHAILFLLSFELISGLISFTIGGPNGAWVFWLHGVAGFSLLGLTVWKRRIVVRSFARRGTGWWSLAPIVLALIFVGALLTGALWAFIGRGSIDLPGYGNVRLLVIHTALGLAITVPLIVHAAARWPRRPRRTDFTSRRAALRLFAVGAAGAALWGTARASAPALGQAPRFTGSRERGSYTGNAHPVTQWLFDSRQRIDRERWRLQVSGRVSQPVVLGYEEVSELANAASESTLDCTGGWFTIQRWSGVPLSALLDLVEPDQSAESIVITSATGYSRRFPIGEADRLLLATHVEGEPLSSGHGAPLRLVAPDRRGYQWVKWVVAVEVSERPSWWQSPLPLQ